MRQRIGWLCLTLMLLCATPASAAYDERSAPRNRVDAYRQQLYRAQADLRRSLLASSGVTQARRTLALEQGAYVNACTAALQPLQDDPAYRAAKARVWEKEQLLRAEHFKHRLDHAAIATLALDLLALRREVSRLEREVLAQDDTVLAHRTRVDDARADLQGRLRSVNEQIRRDPQLVALRRDLRQAREALLNG